jgi:hypothetical protein
MPKVHIDEVFPNNSISPMVVNFQNGYVGSKFKPSCCALLTDTKNNVKCIATEVEHLLYTGKEEKEALGKTLILTRNKTTGKVRLMEVSNVELKPLLKMDTEKSNSELDTSILELSRKFGSKKQKTRMEQKEKLKVNVQTVSEQMHNVTVNVTEGQLDLSSYIKNDSDDFYIPPIDRAADKPENVYDINKILSQEQFKQIFEEIDGKNFMEELPKWMQDIFDKKQLSEEHKVLLLYAASLLKLYSTLMKDISKKGFTVCPQSSTLNDIIFKNFTTCTNGKRNRPLQYKDKAFCHGLVFLLLINNLKFSIDELSKNTKYSVKVLITKFKVIGATIIPSGSSKIAHLKIPLSTPNSGRRKSAKF